MTMPGISFGCALGVEHGTQRSGVAQRRCSLGRADVEIHAAGRQLREVVDIEAIEEFACIGPVDFDFAE